MSSDTRLGKDREQKVFYCLECGGEMLALESPKICPYPRCPGKRIECGTEARRTALKVRAQS